MFEGTQMNGYEGWKCVNLTEIERQNRKGSSIKCACEWCIIYYVYIK